MQHDWKISGDKIGYKGEICNPRMLEKFLLSGADNWSNYSWGGCGLIYNADIAKSLCTPSELKRTQGGKLRPNAREQWLDVQARALFQACDLLNEIIFRG